MMNGRKGGNDPIERLLKQVRPPEPSPLLKRRVTGAAGRAWSETSSAVPWQIPLRRLAVSAAAAVLVVSLANIYSDYALARWRSAGSAAIGRSPAESGAWAEAPYSPCVRWPANVMRASSARDVSALLNYVERVRQILNETPPNGAGEQPASMEGRGRLLPIRPGSDSYA